MNICNQATFDFFKQRANDMFTEGYDTVDERIRPLVQALRSVSGLETVWSCSGHTAAEVTAKARAADLPFPEWVLEGFTRQETEISLIEIWNDVINFIDYWNQTQIDTE